MRKQFEKIQELTKLSSRHTIEHLAKLMEESGELAQEVNKIVGTKNTKEHVEEIRKNILEEGCDAIQCILAILANENHSYDAIKEELDKKNNKWSKNFK
jgi:NTP pyrophosphatase (non-canonical NTP hydrolase)